MVAFVSFIKTSTLLFTIFNSVHSAIESKEKTFNKKLFVMYSVREPFVVETSHANQPKGLDVSIMQNFGKKFKLQIDYVRSNQSLNSVFNSAEDIEPFMENHLVKDVDIFVGALTENIITQKYFTASRAYYEDSLTWCVQMKQPIPKWKKIFKVCNDPRVFMGMLLLSFVVCSSAYFIQQFEDIQPKWDWHRIATVGFANTSGMAYTYDPKHTANRVFYGGCLFGALIYSTVMGAYFMPFMASPIYDDQVNTIDEIVLKNYDMLGDTLALKHMHEQNLTYPRYSVNKFRACDDIDTCLMQLDTNSHAAVAVSLERARCNRLIPMSQIYCFEHSQRITQQPLNILVRKDFPYLSELNRFIYMSVASGLMEKWRMELQVRPDYQYTENDDGQITLENFSGFFVLWITIAIVSSCVFLAEMFIYRKAHQQNPHFLSVLFEMLIDGKRHFLTDSILLKHSE